jgi:hypothetical protein
MQEDYAHWVAIYKNDSNNQVTAVHQKDTNVSYEELDRSDNLIQFQMVKPDGTIILSVPFKPGQGGQLIWRRRRQVDPGGQEVWFYLVGKKSAFVACILPDYSLILDNNFNEDNAVLSGIQPVKGEE